MTKDKTKSEVVPLNDLQSGYEYSDQGIIIVNLGLDSEISEQIGMNMNEVKRLCRLVGLNDILIQGSDSLVAHES